MSQKTLDGTNLTELREEYDRKVNQALPEQAKRCGEWPIQLDHCFGRVVLDNLFEDEWYEHVNGRPAFKYLSAEELTAAIEIADRMLTEGRPVVDALNQNSLRWRDKDG